MKRILGILALFVVLGALAYPKISPLLTSEREDNSDDSYNSKLKVDATVVRPGTVDNAIFTTGTILANEEIELRSEVSGKVTDVYLREGKEVKKDELLLKINDSELQAQLDRTRYRLKLASEVEQRRRTLLEKGGISQQDYDITLNEVNVLEAEIKLIESQIDKTEIRAPFDGIIGLKYISEGSYISPSTRIASLQDINRVKIDFSIPERYVNDVEAGDNIHFTVQGTDKQFRGEIYAIEPRIDSQTRTLDIRAVSENKEGLLVPGAFADIELVLQTIEDALMIPTIALVPELQGQKVYLYTNGQIEEKRVKTGIRTEESVQITEGVAPGDTVLTTGLLQVRPGMQVELNEIVNINE